MSTLEPDKTPEKIQETSELLKLSQEKDSISVTKKSVRSSMWSQKEEGRVIKKHYVFTALIGAVLMALGDVSRGVAADTPYASKFTLSLCYVVLSSILLTISKLRGGEKWTMPWWRESDGLLDDG